MLRGWRGSIEAMPFLEGSHEQCVRDSKGLTIRAEGSSAYGRCNGRHCKVFDNGGDVAMNGLFRGVLAKEAVVRPTVIEAVRQQNSVMGASVE